MSELLLYENTDVNITIDVQLEGETVWLTQEQMATLFSKDKSTINERIKIINREEVLSEHNTMQKFGNSEFLQKAPNNYNLDMIISHQMAVEKSGKEYKKYKEQQKVIEKEASLKELEEDIKKLKKKDK